MPKLKIPCKNCKRVFSRRALVLMGDMKNKKKQKLICRSCASGCKPPRKDKNKKKRNYGVINYRKMKKAIDREIKRLGVKRDSLNFEDE